MNINATLFGQLITFAIFIWITYKFIWPLFQKMLDERQNKIASDIADAEQRVRDSEAMQHQADKELREAKIKAAEILDEANKRAGLLIEEAREKARDEGERLINIARGEIDQEKEAAKTELRSDLARLVIAGTEKILAQKLDNAQNDELINKLITEI